jgi:hypothetical protein
MLFVSAQTRSNRLNACRSCEHYVEKTRSCGPLIKEAFTESPLCGCHMPTKTRLKVASCPLNKWPAVITPAEIEDIRKFLTLSDKQKTDEELTKLAGKYIHASERASSCSGCNKRLIRELQRLVNHADTEA